MHGRSTGVGQLGTHGVSAPLPGQVGARGKRRRSRRAGGQGGWRVCPFPSHRRRCAAPLPGSRGSLGVSPCSQYPPIGVRTPSIPVSWSDSSPGAERDPRVCSRAVTVCRTATHTPEALTGPPDVATSGHDRRCPGCRAGDPRACLPGAADPLVCPGTRTRAPAGPAGLAQGLRLDAFGFVQAAGRPELDGEQSGADRRPARSRPIRRATSPRGSPSPACGSGSGSSSSCRRPHRG